MEFLSGKVKFQAHESLLSLSMGNLKIVCNIARNVLCKMTWD